MPYRTSPEYFAAVQSMLADNTRELYAMKVRSLQEWSSQQGITWPHLTTLDLIRYCDARQKAGSSPGTINSDVWAFRRYFSWLVEQEVLDSSPAADLPLKRRDKVQARDTITVEQLRAMWDACSDARDRAIIGLLGINALRPDELMKADLSQLGEVEGLPVLRIEPRGRYHNAPVTVLSPEVHEAICQVKGDRRAGPIFVTPDNKKLNRGMLLRVVKRVGKHAGVPIEVTPLTLSFTLRAVAIERGFSYVGVLRAAGEADPSRVKSWINRASNPLSHHAALRLSRIVFGAENETGTLLGQAEALLGETDFPPAMAVMAAGATIEQHLRVLVREGSLPLTTPEKSGRAKMGTYYTALSRAKAIQPSDVQKLESIQSARDRAAHGWFEEVSREEALYVLREARSFAERFPVKGLRRAEGPDPES